MGRSYWFECAKCGYRAKVSGRTDRGLGFSVQTILCRDCKELYDAVTRLRVPDEREGWRNVGGLRRLATLKPRPNLTAPPSFQAVLNRLPPMGMQQFKWLPFKLQCPVSSLHRVRGWNDPDRCPKCGVYLERSALPYRLWD